MKKIKIDKTSEVLYYKKLNNGLELYVLPNINQKNFYITYSTKFGSINTEFKANNSSSFTKVPNGIAHYLEHLMFNMENGSAFDYFSKLGSSVNAFTSYNVTCYEVFSSTYFKENLEYLLDYVGTPYFTKESVNNERGIIEEEISMYENNPNSELVYKAYNNIFVNDKHSELISGKKEDIKKITIDNLYECYNTFYNPNNMFIIITGNVNPYEALAIIEENMSKKEYNNPTIINKSFNEPIKVKTEYEEKYMNVEINKVNISFKIPKKNFKCLGLSDIELEIYIGLLFNILFGSTSILQDKLITSKIVSNGINISKTFTKDYIVVSLLSDTEYVETYINMVRDTMKNIKISESELERKLKVYKSNYILHFDDIELVNNNIQDNILMHGKVVNNYLNIYENINIDKLNEVIKRIKNKSESILVIKPIE